MCLKVRFGACMFLKSKDFQAIERELIETSLVHVDQFPLESSFIISVYGAIPWSFTHQLRQLGSSWELASQSSLWEF